MQDVAISILVEDSMGKQEVHQVVDSVSEAKLSNL